MCAAHWCKCMMRPLLPFNLMKFTSVILFNKNKQKKQKKKSKTKSNKSENTLHMNDVCFVLYAFLSSIYSAKQYPEYISILLFLFFYCVLRHFMVGSRFLCRKMGKIWMSGKITARNPLCKCMIAIYYYYLFDEGVGWGVYDDIRKRR